MTTYKTSILRSLVPATILAFGFGTAWLVLVLWVGSSIQEAWPRRIRPPREGLAVLPDGTPLVESTPQHDLSLATYRDREGRAHDPVDRKSLIPAVSMRGAPEEVPGVFWWEPGWSRRIRVFLDERERAAVWYFVHDGKPQGSGYFVGYERKSNRLIGFIGLRGFRAQAVPPGERIPVRGELAADYSSWSSAPTYSRGRWQSRPDRWDLPPRLVHVPSGNLLRLVDLGARTVTTVLEAPEPIEAVGIPALASSAAHEFTRNGRSS